MSCGEKKGLMCWVVLCRREVECWAAGQRRVERCGSGLCSRRGSVSWIVGGYVVRERMGSREDAGWRCWVGIDGEGEGEDHDDA